MSTTDVSGIRTGGRVETERKERSSDTSSSSVNAAPHAVNDAVELSVAAQQLSSLNAKLASINDVDMGKVDEIRHAISNGSYEVDPQKIAESLIALENEIA